MARVLIVDDTAFFRIVLRELLEGEGHEVLEGRDGPEGVRLFERERPDLVITDLALPGLGGDGVVEAIRALCPPARIIVLSGSLAVDPARPESTGKLPPEIPFITKPFKADQLLSVVTTLLAES